jgi:hypothetical protein
MLGAIVLVVAMLAFIPLVLLSGMVASAILGTVLKGDAEARHEGSELIDLNA